jgi:hypothetical protein
MIGHPTTDEAAPYYFLYIDQVFADDVVNELDSQLTEALVFLRGISEEKSRYRYAPEKWSMRQVLSHVNDGERVFLFRALWFARGFTDPLPSYDQNVGVNAALADEVSWANHIEEFRRVRLATLSFFQGLPAEAWQASGIASDNRFTVRALAFIIAGHVTHHIKVLKEHYL